MFNKILSFVENNVPFVEHWNLPCICELRFFFISAAADNSYCSINSSRTFLLFRLFIVSVGLYTNGTYKYYFLTTFSLNVGPTILFTHLKIILLQYFQFK